MHGRVFLFALCQVAWHISPGSAAPYQNRMQETGSIFSAPEDNGVWQMVSYKEYFDDYYDYGYGYEYEISSLAFIRTMGAASSNVQVQITPSDYGYDYLVVDSTTGIAQQNDGVWQLADYDGDSKLDLIYIQNRNTASGKVEVSVLSGSSSFQTYLLQGAQTVFDVQIDGSWQMVDVDSDSRLDLVYIQNSNTPSNKVEVYVASGASTYTTLSSQTESSFPIANDGTWLLADYGMDGTYDLFYIQNINTASGYVEVNVASGASGYQTIVQSVSTTFVVENSGTWLMFDWNGDNVLDLVYIKQEETAGTVEVHVASGN